MPSESNWKRLPSHKLAKFGIGRVATFSLPPSISLVDREVTGGWPALAFFARVECDAAYSLVVVWAIALFRMRARPQDPTSCGICGSPPSAKYAEGWGTRPD